MIETSSSSKQQSRAALKRLLCGVGMVLLTTMPRWIYIGDPIQMRAGTIEFLTKGTFEIPREFAEQSGDRGHYFCENERNGRWFSKYGIANSLLYVPPLAVEYLQNEKLPHFDELSHEDLANRCFLLNLYNITIGLILAAYLFHLALLFAHRATSAVKFVLLTFFTTFLWNYLRAQTVEIFQVLFFTAAFYHLVRAHHGRSAEEVRTGEQVRHAVLTMVWVGLLCLEKQVYVLLVPITTAFLLLSMLGGGDISVGSLSRSVRSVLPQWKITAAVCLPGALTAILVLSHNWYCFGSPFLTGYHQFEKEKPILSWNLGEGLYGFTLGPQKSVFLYFPLVVVALLGLRKFFKDHAFEFCFAAVVAGVYFPLNSAFSVWHGGWCYGPRYLLFMLPVLSLPLVTLLDAETLSLAWRRVSSGIIAVLVIWSLLSQPLIQGIEFFAYYRTHDPFMVGVHEPRIDEYFEQPFWIIHRDLMRYRSGRAPLRPLEFARESYPEETVSQIENELRTFPIGNMYWLMPRSSDNSAQNASVQAN